MGLDLREKGLVRGGVEAVGGGRGRSLSEKLCTCVWWGRAGCLSYILASMLLTEPPDAHKLHPHARHDSQ